MRIKFKKGMTPERIAACLVEIIRENGLVIGAVNIYIQTYNEEMKPEKYVGDEEYLVVEPGRQTKEEYREDIAEIRRSRMKAV